MRAILRREGRPSGSESGKEYFCPPAPKSADEDGAPIFGDYTESIDNKALI